MPIYQTTSYAFRDTAHAAALFGLAEPGNIYTRIMNPTQSVFEERIADLEGGVGALAAGLRPGGRDPGHPEPGRGRRPHRLLALALRRHLQPLPLHAAQARDQGRLRRRPRRPRRSGRAAVTPNTRAFYGETIGNPKGDVLDIEGIAGVAHAHNVPLIVDNTLATPYLANPLAHGADIVVHSATKFIGGHGTAIGGVIVDGGSFDFGASGRYAMFTEPDPSYHGLKYWEALGPGSYIAKARVQYLRDLGAAIAPLNAFLFLQGLETLSLRMERHVAERPGRGRVPRGARRGRVGRLPGPGLLPVARAGQAAPARRAPARSSPSGSRAAPRPARGSSRASSSSATWPTWATCAASPSTRPRRRTRS